MNLTVSQYAIVEGVKKAGWVITAKGGTAHLRDIWLKADDAGLTIMASSGEVEFSGTYPATVQKPGFLGTHGVSFVQFVSNLPPAELHLHATGRGLHVKGQDIDYDLQTTDTDAFQPLMPFPSPPPALISWETLHQVLDKVEFCIDPFGSGAACCLMIRATGEDMVEFAGSDHGSRLALLVATNSDLHDTLPAEGLLIQRQYLPFLRKLADGGSVEVGISDRRLFLRNTSTDETMSVPRTFAEPIRYQKLAEGITQCRTHLEVDRKDLVKALTRLQIFTSETNEKMLLSVQNGEVVLQLASAGHASCVERLKIDDPPLILEEGFSQAFKPSMLLEIAQHYSSERIDLYLQDQYLNAMKGRQDPGYTVFFSSYYDDNRK
ncbi:MAG: hypothetical protein LBR22_10575 [Desulfovibrio sp.]|jgi:DNA polymerase-3 subunit beta|nr:hypothetical protein [Desulfovibrio sp.]